MVVHYTNCHLVTWWPTSLFAHTVKLRSVCGELCNLCNTLTKVCKCAADEVFIINHVMYSVLCVIYIVQCCWDFLFCRECRICSSTLLHTETDSINIVRLSWESWIPALNFDQFLQKNIGNKSEISFQFSSFWMLPAQTNVQWSEQSEETHENAAYFDPTIIQGPCMLPSIVEREEGIKTTSIVRSSHPWLQ